MEVALKRNETIGLLLSYARPHREVFELAFGEKAKDALVLLLLVILFRAAKLEQVLLPQQPTALLFHRRPLRCALLVSLCIAHDGSGRLVRAD